MINYYLITKPGILLGNLVTFTAGFLLASKQPFHLALFLWTLVGLALIMASACVFNNYIDRMLDKKMDRTKNRPIASGLISERNALLFGSALGIIGSLILINFTNTLAFLVSAIGFFVYVVLYSLWKSRTVYGTAIGSIAGAVPPVVGYCANSNHFDMGAFILFIMLVLWQMPHFFSIALFHLEDYTKAKIPVLPVEKGLIRTKIHMVIYIVAFIFSAALLTWFGYAGNLYLFVTSFVGLVWLALGIKGFAEHNHHLWGRRMFYTSLVVITMVSFLISVDHVVA